MFTNFMYVLCYSEGASNQGLAGGERKASTESGSDEESSNEVCVCVCVISLVIVMNCFVYMYLNSL